MLFSEANRKECNRIKSLNIPTAEKFALLKLLLERDRKEKEAYLATPEGIAKMAAIKAEIAAMSEEDAFAMNFEREMRL